MLEENEIEPGVLIEETITYSRSSRIGRLTLGIVNLTVVAGIIGMEFYMHMDPVARLSGLVIAGICTVGGIGNIRDGIRGSTVHINSTAEQSSN